MSPAVFPLGQIVYLKSDPSLKGAVVEVLPGKVEDRIKIFVDGKIQTYYASQLQAEDEHSNAPTSLSCDQ